MSKLLTKNATAVLAIAVALGAGVATTALVSAAVPSSADGQIHACYRNSASLTDAKGALRILDSDAGQTCTGSESAVAWNPQGRVSGTLRRDLAGVTIGSATIMNQNLRGANFTGTDFTDSTLNHDDFTGADFSGATLYHTTFINPNFHGVNFSGATISHIYLPDIRVYVGEPDAMADFTNADFSGATLDYMDTPGPFWSYDFRGANFANATIKTFVGAGHYTGIDFRNTHFVPGDFGITGFSNADLSYANFSGMTLDHFVASDVDTYLAHANFHGVTITNGVLQVFQGAEGADFTDATFKGTTINYGLFDGADFTGASFENGDLTDSKLKHANLTNTTWTNTICPDKTNSDNNGNTCVGHYLDYEE